MLTTEGLNPATRDLDTLSTVEILERMADQDAQVAPAVRRELAHIARAVDIIVGRLERGGRLLYFGAGTSGRLGVLDAAECPPTFSTPPGQVQAFIAGGPTALTSSAEAVEDDEAAGRADARAAGVGELDAVVGIAASGLTPYVLGALTAAREQGAATICLISNRPSPLAEIADVTIAPITGPELVAGSTRLKAGSAQKMALNMLSTASMVRLGKVYGNLMVDVQPTNRKLRARARRIVETAANVPAAEAERCLQATGYQVKAAAVMALAGIGADEARERLAASRGRVREAVAAGEPQKGYLQTAEPPTFVVHGRVFTPDRVLEDGVVVLSGTRILSVGTAQEYPAPSDARTIDAGGAALVPGLIDLHIHGLLGFDVMAGGAAEMAAELPRFGVTAFLATTLTAPLEATRVALERLAGAMRAPRGGARILGAHLEGPYLAPEMAGMMAPGLFRRFSWSEFEDLDRACGGHVRLITLAPEVGDAMRAIPQLLEHGVVPSIGHSAATFDQVAEAVRLGLNHATHTFNAMRPFHHREPGVVGAVWHFDEITGQLIGDGHHVHPVAMKALLRLKGVERVALVSDAVPPTGLPPGDHTWLGERIISDGQTMRLAGGGLAGSASLLNAGLGTVVAQTGLPLERALVIAAATPARVLGLPKGRLQAGYDADLVILGADYRPRLTMVEGDVVFEA